MIDYYDGVRILRNKDTKEPVGIEWRLDNGRNIKYYPEHKDDEWFSIFIDEVRKESNTLRRYRYNCLSLDAFEYEGDYFASYDTPESYIDLEEEKVEVDMFLDSLTEIERKYLDYKLNNVDISLREIARQTNRSATAIHKTFEKIRKKYLLFANSQNPKIFNMQ